jgi:hypothetical protein
MKKYSFYSLLFRYSWLTNPSLEDCIVNTIPLAKQNELLQQNKFDIDVLNKGKLPK